MRANAQSPVPLNVWDPAKLLRVMQPMWPGPISERAAKLMLERGRVKKFKSGEAIARQGAPSRGLHIMLSGQAEVVSVRPTGRELTRYVLGPGEGYSFLHIYHPDPHSSSLSALGACEVLILSKEDWLRTTDECTELKDAVIAIVTHRLRLALETIELNNSSTGLGRLAHRLLWHIRKAPTVDSPDPNGRAALDVLISQADLARMLNLSRQRTNALLRRLAQTGAISMRYRHIVIEDLALLRKIIASEDAA